MRKPEGNSLAGRLRRRWENNIKRQWAVRARQAYVTDAKYEMDCYQKIAVLSRFSNVITEIRGNLAVICCLRRHSRGPCQSADTMVPADGVIQSRQVFYLRPYVYSEMLRHIAQRVCSCKTCPPAEQYWFLIFKDISQQKY